MRKKRVQVELQHLIFGKIIATSAGRADSGHFLTCTSEDGCERRLLTLSVYWKDPEKVQDAFDKIFAPINAANVKALRRGERYDVGWR